MSVLGLTIDYGPYGWLEVYDTSWTPNTTDAGQRRYCFGNQAQVSMWNLARFAESIRALIPDGKILEAAIMKDYGERFSERHREMALKKLGVTQYQAGRDDNMLEGLGKCLRLVETDMTLFYRKLANVEVEEAQWDALTDAQVLSRCMTLGTSRTLSLESIARPSLNGCAATETGERGTGWRLGAQGIDESNQPEICDA